MSRMIHQCSCKRLSDQAESIVSPSADDAAQDSLIVKKFPPHSPDMVNSHRIVLRAGCRDATREGTGGTELISPSRNAPKKRTRYGAQGVSMDRWAPSTLEKLHYMG
jgi:hypothetical protein